MNHEMRCAYCHTDMRRDRAHDEKACGLTTKDRRIAKLEHVNTELKAALARLLFQPHVLRDHMTCCDKIMGAAHPCTCRADEYRSLLVRHDVTRAIQ